MALVKQKTSDNRISNILIYGESGRGKTYSLRTLNFDKTIVVDFEKGLASLGDIEPLVWDCTAQDTSKEKMQYFVEFIKFAKLPETMEKFDTIVIDSISEMGETLLNAFEKDPDYSGKAKMLPRYGALGKESVELIKILRDLPHYTKIYIGVAEREQDENGNFSKGVGYPGKTSQKMPGYMDAVLYLEAKKDSEGVIQRAFLTENVGNIIAKDRSGKLAKYEEPDMAAIIKKLNS